MMNIFDELLDNEEPKCAESSGVVWCGQIYLKESLQVFSNVTLKNNKR